MASVNHLAAVRHAQEDPTSPTLIMALQRGDDDDAWQRLVRIYGPLILRWCGRCGLQESDAADVSQEVLADLSRSIHGFSARGDGATFRGWLWTITRNKIADYCRRWSKAPVASGGTGALQLIERLPAERPETEEDVADLHFRALDELKDKFHQTTWIAFWRVAVEGDTVKDVAEDLGITVWTVYKAKTRVMARLRAELGG